MGGVRLHVPGDEKKAPNLKILEMAHAWKQAAKKRKASMLKMVAMTVAMMQPTQRKNDVAARH